MPEEKKKTGQLDADLKIAVREYFDPADGGFFFSGEHNEALLFRFKDAADGALPTALVLEPSASNGLPARIVCTDAKGYRPVIALIMDSDGRSEFPMQYTVQGRHDVRDNVTTNVDLHLYEEGGED